MLLLALHRARRSITGLTFVSIEEVLGGYNTPLGCLKNLEILTLDFSEELGSRTPRWNHNPATMVLWPWLRSATSLKHLTLIQCVLRGAKKENLKSVDFFRILYLDKVYVGDTKFPVLESLHLKYVTTRGDALCSFLRDHRKTLTSLTIDRPQMRSEDWKRLRGKTLNGDADGMVMPPSVKTMLSKDVYNPSVNSEDRYRRMEVVPL